MYGDETWTIGGSDKKRLLAFEAWCYRRILKVSWTERITNEEVFQRVEEQISMLKFIKEEE